MQAVLTDYGSRPRNRKILPTRQHFPANLAIMPAAREAFRMLVARKTAPDSEKTTTNLSQEFWPANCFSVTGNAGTTPKDWPGLYGRQRICVRARTRSVEIVIGSDDILEKYLLTGE